MKPRRCVSDLDSSPLRIEDNLTSEHYSESDESYFEETGSSHFEPPSLTSQNQEGNRTTIGSELMYNKMIDAVDDELFGKAYLTIHSRHSRKGHIFESED